ncbi:MAG TPA: extracellular solute-binding protein [Rhodocyclaceae bacterium]|nr:extracellular solute-binding protein [Rhodocyclaceae bacterium]
MMIHRLLRLTGRCRSGLIGLLLVPCLALAQTVPKPSEVYLYRGPDREQRLIDGAAKEATVVLYTSLNVKDSLPIIRAFEKKYKKYGLKVSMWRASGEKVVQRALTEARAGRYAPDVLESDDVEMEILHREQLLAKFYSPAFKHIPESAVPPHREYVPDRFNFFTIAYNTNLVKPDQVPNSYDDLLKPRWAGKICIEAGDVDWFGGLVKSMGEQKGMAFFQKLAASHPQVRTGHTLISELVAAGEIPIAADIYNHAVEHLEKKGAPIKWKALAPTMARSGAIGLARRAPHPYAALLFADFMLSREGQELIKKRNRIPASDEVDSPLNKFEYRMIDPAVVLDESAKWKKLWSDLFLKDASVAAKP